MEAKIDELRCELLQCAVCLGEMVRPRALQCLHSFCEDCIMTHANNYRENRASSTTYFPCPSCRLLTLLPSEGVQGLKKDFRTEKIIDTLRTFSTHSCNICSVATNIVQKAVKYCVDCNKNLCHRCVQCHHRRSSLLSHLLFDLPENSFTRRNARRNDSCAIHPTEKEKYRCCTCDRKLCIACLSIHDDDHHVISEDQMSDVSSDVHRITQQVHDKFWHVHEVIFRLTILEGKFKAAYDESKLQIRKQPRKYMAKLMAEESRLLKNLDGIYREKSEELFKRKEECKAQLDDLENLQSRIHFLLTLDDGTEKVLEVYPILQEKIDTVQQMLLDLENNLNLLSDFVKFTPSSTSLSLGSLDRRLLYEARRAEHGNVTTRVNVPDVLESQVAPLSSSSSLLTDVIEPFFPNPSPRKKPTRSVSLPQEAASNHTCPRIHLLCRFGNSGSRIGEFSLPYNMCFLKDDTIAVADLGNKRIQLVDKYGHCQKIIAQGEIIPRTITTTTDGTIAITDEQDKTVKVFSSSGDLLTNLRMDSLSFPYGIAAMSDRNFAVTDMIYESISIIGSMGRMILRFGSHGRADNCLDNPGCLFVDADDNIFVSDSGNHCIKVFNSNGRFLYRIGCYGEEDGQLKYPKAICSDGRGHLFIADSGNDRVVAFTTAGCFLRTLVSRSSGAKRPMGLTCNFTGQLLAVSLPDLGEIRVYKVDIV